jgi:lipopolysaccharide transport system ATP-binding protein
MDVPAPAPVALRLRGVGKRYDIYPNDRSRVLEMLGPRVHHTEHWALRGVDLEVPRGGALGVIGRNGAGKSTLLRILAGISPATEGTVEVHGRLATLLDLGVGFHETFTGRENIALTCSLLGLSRAQAEARTPDILRFAELGAFIDQPVRTYSTGMCLRLGFAIASHVDAEILVVDEVLAVGDQYFQRKCLRRVAACREAGATLVVVSHDLHAIRALCDEVVWIEAGTVHLRGSARQVVESYVRHEAARAAPPLPDSPSAGGLAAPPQRPPALPEARTTPFLAAATPAPEDPAALADVIARACAPADPAALFDAEAGEAPRAMDGDTPRVLGTGEVRIVSVDLLDGTGTPRAQLRTGEDLVVAVTFRTTEPVQDPIFGVALFRDDGTYVFGPNTRWDGVLEGRYHGVYTFYAHYPALALLAGQYRVSVAVFDAGHVSALAWHNQLYGFEVVQDVEDHGLVRLSHRWGVVTHHRGDGGGA